MKTKIILLIGASFFLAFAACKKQEMAMDESKLEASAPSVAPSGPVETYIPPQSQYGTVTQCPVTKDKVVVNKETAAVRYAGEAYYFCCPSCIDAFKSNPEKYKNQ
ncbi:MAG: hypothetical protein A2204_06465 [Elusimicrobia bacterium RIFOXYA1_FULL_47_7]|nr:MAG: hypothetical protein A2278_05980 [Elusimicrobia bacterium RIFOXYA12_FULL_49_49]OGS08000.1 MAG: hypothetical protein A2204_06465 [Elusimicrobia bacterium RIFOXYA1_FULL_47_7]OGS11325.1 MAG: hypothetical protein A2386_08400 [Elusimicrobia bacterium RIFOXYB1_FULL_48_9]OGS16658.1 MAG: hypothetical protein A2251_04755 [Elusimicrobia bacterium RIFOXYA2_FULL_47_53]OGS25507.1 MAG: hypothetical protein A2339_00330 [Elusimicrobia bacterium RIFOXYB12_FULL_50_12]OGS31636.1 MAG: hypothetical protein